MVSICVKLSFGSQPLWMSWLDVFSWRVFVMWGVSSRPVQMAKRESEERRAADKHTHPGHCWWPQWNNSSLGAADKACSRESSKANKGMLPTYHRLVYRLTGHIVSLSCQSEDLLYCRWYISVFPLLVCLHSHCDCWMITFEAFNACIFVQKAKPYIRQLPGRWGACVSLPCVYVDSKRISIVLSGKHSKVYNSLFAYI